MVDKIATKIIILDFFWLNFFTGNGELAELSFNIDLLSARINNLRIMCKRKHSCSLRMAYDNGKIMWPVTQ